VRLEVSSEERIGLPEKKICPKPNPSTPETAEPVETLSHRYYKQPQKLNEK
jgi:hypothetical protein